MSGEHRIEIRLRLDGGADTLAGDLRDGAIERPFVGWLALVAALEQARRRAASERDLGVAGNSSEIDGDLALDNRRGSE